MNLNLPRKPAPMDEDILELTRKCAEAMGYRLDSDGGFSRLRQGAGMDEPDWFEFIYAPASDPAQAFELLCWLSARCTITADFRLGRFLCTPHDRMSQMDDVPCTTPAELRLALMRAVCKVHEGSKP